MSLAEIGSYDIAVKICGENLPYIKLPFKLLERKPRKKVK
jgi:hypothetical protein